MHSDPLSPTHEGLSPTTVKRIKWGLVALGVLGVALVVFLVAREIHQENVTKRWDDLARIKEQYESSLPMEPLLSRPDPAAHETRDRYIAALEAFIQAHADEADDALLPHTHWLVAKVAADQLMSMRNVLDLAKRRPYYERIIEHLKVLRDDFPDFQTNWLEFAPQGQTSLTRAFLETMQANLAWEEKYFPKPHEPKQDVVVLVRTERGDMRFGLYSDLAPELTRLFLDRAVRGEYDGTAFFAKVDDGTDDAPRERSIRAGHPSTRGAEPFDRKAAQAFTEDVPHDPMMPEMARYRITMDRGVVAAWHDPTTDYDGSPVFLVLTGRSPQLDHLDTPMGALLDDASRATADRIFAGDTWGSSNDAGTHDDTLAQILQAPVPIVKVLVYEDGTLREPAAGTAPDRAPLDPSEKSLGTVKPDAYLAEPPTPPAPPPGPEEGGTGTDSGSAPKDTGTPKTPGTPGASDAPGAPGAPDAPGAPGAPDAPGAPGAPGAADAPGAPGASDAPGAPPAPEAPQGSGTHGGE